VVRAERALHTAYAAVLGSWLTRVRSRVVQGSRVDPSALAATVPTFSTGVDNVVDIQVREIFERAFEAEAGFEPNANFHVERYLTTARNRMTNTPDSVYHMIRQEIADATAQGMPVEELALAVDKVLGNEGVETWANRGMVVARTETIAAYNAGTFAGMQSLAGQLGGEWEKGWLSTHDNKTRPTHQAADIETSGTGQRVPLGEPFIVGGFAGMYPGSPELPPQECIQCRCSLVLLRPGERPSLADRHMRKSS